MRQTTLSKLRNSTLDAAMPYYTTVGLKGVLPWYKLI